MKTIENMTPAELRELADKKEIEEENKIYKVGYLKYDLYESPISDSGQCCFTNPSNDFWLYNKNQINILIRKFKESCKCVLPAKTKFICLMDNGKELWYDGHFGLKEMDVNWAKKYLENITVKYYRS